jgi:hypothetical protein
MGKRDNTTGMAEKKSQVFNEVERIGANANCLAELISGLINKLSPVLRMPEGDKTNPTGTSGELVPLANEINIVNSVLDTQIKRLEAISKLIEL